MTNLLIASFKEEAEAVEASNKLNELETIGDITIYEMVVIKKNADGEAVVLQADTNEGVRTLSGMAIGTLIGSLAGPVGVVAGMFTGTLAGMAMEEDHYGFAEDFTSKVNARLQPGETALVAEIDEDNQVFVDGYLTPLGATLTRTDVDYEYDEYSDEEMDELDEEIATERAKIKSATDADKSKIRKKIADLKEKRKERIADLKEKLKEAAADVKTAFKDQKTALLRDRIEKHQKKIAALEKKLQKALGKVPAEKEVEH
jgi:uncharacterized membrane protein